jgi:hypothetical protein
MPLYAFHWSSVALFADADAMLATSNVMGLDVMRTLRGPRSTNGAPARVQKEHIFQKHKSRKTLLSQGSTAFAMLLRYWGHNSMRHHAAALLLLFCCSPSNVFMAAFHVNSQSRSVGHAMDGSQRAMLVVTQRNMPGTGQFTLNGSCSRQKRV